jgi:hypothetical protein
LARVTWDQAEPVTITRRHDVERLEDVFTVDKVPAVVEIADEVFEQVSEFARWHDVEAPITVDWGEKLVRWRFANCRCAYRIVDYHALRNTHLCERLAALGDARG